MLSLKKHLPCPLKNTLRPWLEVVHSLMPKALANQMRLRLAEATYLFYKKKFNPPAEHWQYAQTPEKIYGNRKTGVSGYYRIYNEEEFLRTSVLSHLPFFDELILVHDSTTTDRTPEIAAQLVAEYPDKIRYIPYLPIVFKLRTKAYRILPINHPNSFINYYNFALAQSSRKIVAKVDADHIAIPKMFERAAKNFHNMDFMDNVFYAFSGLNLWFVDGRLLVDPNHIAGHDNDHGFHVLHKKRKYYKKCIPTEFMSSATYTTRRAGILYFHLKHMRKWASFVDNRGRDKATQIIKFKQRFQHVYPHLLDWQSFVSSQHWQEFMLLKTDGDITELPDPNILLADLLKTAHSLNSKDFGIVKRH